MIIFAHLRYMDLVPKKISSLSNAVREISVNLGEKRKNLQPLTSNNHAILEQIEETQRRLLEIQHLLLKYGDFISESVKDYTRVENEIIRLIERICSQQSYISKKNIVDFPSGEKRIEYKIRKEIKGLSYASIISLPAVSAFYGQRLVNKGKIFKGKNIVVRAWKSPPTFR